VGRIPVLCPTGCLHNGDSPGCEATAVIPLPELDAALDANGQPFGAWGSIYVAMRSLQNLAESMGWRHPDPAELRQALDFGWTHLAERWIPEECLDEGKPVRLGPAIRRCTDRGKNFLAGTNRNDVMRPDHQRMADVPLDASREDRGMFGNPANVVLRLLREDYAAAIARFRRQLSQAFDDLTGLEQEVLVARERVRPESRRSIAERLGRTQAAIEHAEGRARAKLAAAQARAKQELQANPAYRYGREDIGALHAEGLVDVAGLSEPLWSGSR
jgi:hypothetical protein